MQVDNLTKGRDIELEVRFNGKSMNFRSEIVLVVNNSVLIECIKVDEQTVGFSENCYINFLYKSEGKLYIWENVDIKLVKYDGAIYHKAELSGDGKPYNRRNSYRLYLGEEMTLSINTATGPSAVDVLVKDISETGVGFITKEDLDIGRTFRMRIKDNRLLVNLSGVIVRKENLEHLHSTLYGCKFNEKNQLLGRFIAKKQGELLRKKNNLSSSPVSKEIVM